MAVSATKVKKATKAGINKKNIYWIITFVVPILIMLIPTNETFTQDIRLFFALTIAAILLWAFEIVQNLVVSLILPVLYIVFNLAPAQVVFSPWSSYIPWLMLSGMILTNIFEETGFLKRIAYWCILKVGGSYRGILYGLNVCGIIIALVITDNASRAIMFAALSYGICKALELEDGGKASSGIMLAGIFAALNPGYIFLTSAGQTIIAYDIAAKLGVDNNWISYFVHNGIPTLIWCFLSVLIIDMLFKPDEKIKSKAFFEEEYRKLGKVSTKEKKLTIIFFLIILAILTTPYHNIGVGWIFVIATAICFLPVINIGNDQATKKINFSICVFVTATMAIGAVSNVIGAGKCISDLLYPYLSGSKLYTFSAVWLLAVIMNFVMTPLAAVATLTEPIVVLAQQVGLNPSAVIYAWCQGLEQIILPYEYALVLLVFSYGYLSLKNLIKAFSVKMFFNIVFLIIIAVPFWKLINAF